MTKLPGVILIHGFTSNRASLEPLLPILDQRGLDWRLPILAGHGTRPEDLRDMRWADWQRDVQVAYDDLRRTHNHIIIVALSMGTLLALQLAAAKPDHIAGLVLISPCLKFKNKLAPLTPLIAPLIKKFPFPSKNKFSAASFTKNDRGYLWFPTAAYRSYWEQTRGIFLVAATVKCPVRIIQSRNDRVADPRGAQLLFDVLPGEKELLWHQRSGHEALLDAEAGEIINEVINFAPLRG